MKKIKLTQGQFALIDNEDFERVSKYKWHADYNKTTKSYYAKTTPYIGHNKSKNIRMHRFIMNVPRVLQVDHINKNTLDNRKSNLRFCTREQNMWNSKSRSGTSKYKGVSFDKQKKKWMARISSNRKIMHIGYYISQKDAAIAYNKKAKKIHGDFAFLNLIGVN